MTAAALLLLVFLAVLVRTARISDDGLTSPRTVPNAARGDGPTLNVGERLHPKRARILDGVVGPKA